MANVGTHNIGSYKQGSQIPTKTFVFQVDGGAPPSAIASCEMQLRKDNRLIHTYSSANGDFTVTPPDTVALLAHELPIKADTYDYDLRLTFVDGSSKIWLEGTFEVVEAQTK